MGVVWVVVAALAFGVGSLAQAAATLRRPDAGFAALVRHPLFLAGTLAELVGAGAHLIALQTVSMAVAQCAVSGSLAVTALGARLVFGTRLGRRGVAAVAASSLALVALSAVSGEATTITGSTAVEVVLAVAALLLGLGGAAAAALRPALRGPALAVASGLSFAACSIAARLLDTSSAVAVLTDPAVLLLAVTGGLGCLYWTLALRHAPVTVVTAVVVVTEVVPPSLVGPLLGDAVGVAFALVAPLALAATAASAAVLARLGRAEGAVGDLNYGARRGRAPAVARYPGLSASPGGSMAPTRGRRPVEEPGAEAGDLAERLGLDDPSLQSSFATDLESVRDAELRGEFDTDGIRLR